MTVQLIYTTFPDQETAIAFTKKMVEEKLIACANLIPMTSVYPWDGVVQTGGEVAAILKTTQENASKAMEWLEENHPYDVPCCIDLGAKPANSAYAQWVQSVLVKP